MTENETTIDVAVIRGASTQTDVTRRKTRAGKGCKISDYFEKFSVSTTALARQDTAPSLASSSPSIEDSSVGKACECHTAHPNSDPEPIEFKKITAGNGWQAAKRLQIPPKKRVKRETLFDDELDRNYKVSVGQRQGSRAKLGLLPSLPVDTLFEVRYRI